MEDPSVEVRLVGEGTPGDRFTFYKNSLVPAPTSIIFNTKDMEGQWDIGSLHNAFLNHRSAEFYWFLASNNIAIENVLLTCAAFSEHFTHIGFRITDRHTTKWAEFDDWALDMAHRTKFRTQASESGLQFNNDYPKDCWIVTYNDRMPRTTMGVMGIFDKVEWAIWKLIKTGTIGAIWQKENEFLCTEEGDALILADFLDTLGMLKEPSSRYDRKIGSLRMSPAFYSNLQATHYAPSVSHAKK